MKWPEEQRVANGYSGRYRRDADALLSRYRTAPWRKKAVSCVRPLIEQCLLESRSSGGRPRPPAAEQLRERLEVAGLSEAIQEITPDDAQIGMSLVGAVLAEAAGAVFCSRPNVARWQMVGRIIGGDLIASMTLLEVVRDRTEIRPRLRDQIREVAGKLVRDFTKNPASLVRPSDNAALAELHTQWSAKPNLQEIWFGVRANQYLTPFRGDWNIFDLLFETDIEYAVELMEEYRAPFQPAMILDLGAADPGRYFAQWAKLTKAALPAFDENGDWNGRILLPLLLHIAHSAVRGGIPHSGMELNQEDRRDARLQELAEAATSTVRERVDGSSATLRWSAWLFRSIMSALDNERIPYPVDANSRARPAWLMIEALLHWPGSIGWLELQPNDVPSADQLCVEAVRMLAAHEHGRPVPGRDILFQMLPEEPEQFLEESSGAHMRELPSLFTVWGKRPDAFGTRVLAAALFDTDVAEAFAELWHRTLILREIAEHNHAFRADDGSYDDRARRASETIRFIISLGINLLDDLQDARYRADFVDRRKTLLALFSTLHDATREILAIDPIGRREIENIHDHLGVRRLAYEASPLGTVAVTVPLSEADAPTAGDILFERSEVSSSFFNCLQMLLANGIARERIDRALREVGVSLDHLAQQAQRLNSIEHTHVIDVSNL